MRITTILTATIGAALLFLLPVGAAFAQAVGDAAPASSTTVSLGPVLGDITNLAVTALAVAGAWVLALLKRKLGIDQSSAIAATLDSALINAARYGLMQTQRLATTPGVLSIDVHNATVAAAINYATQHVPDAIKHFGFDAAALERMITARLHAIDPTVTIPASVVATLTSPDPAPAAGTTSATTPATLATAA